MQSKEAACNTGRSLQQATPEDTLVHFTQHWLPTSCRLPDSRWRAHSNFRQLVQHKIHLSSEFELLGWNPPQPDPNPMHSEPNQKPAEKLQQPCNSAWLPKERGIVTDRAGDALSTPKHGQHLQQQQHQIVSAAAFSQR